MVFSAKKNNELLTLTKSISNDLDLLCKAVLDVFEKLGSKLESMDKQMKSLEKKLDDIGEEDRQHRRRRSCCSMCTIS